MTPWQPINTAPRDRRILLWTGTERHCAQWSKNPFTGHEAWLVARYGEEGDCLILPLDLPTRWAELLEQPEEAAQ